MNVVKITRSGGDGTRLTADHDQHLVYGMTGGSYLVSMPPPPVEEGVRLEFLNKYIGSAMRLTVTTGNSMRLHRGFRGLVTTTEVELLAGAWCVATYVNGQWHLRGDGMRDATANAPSETDEPVRNG